MKAKMLPFFAVLAFVAGAEAGEVSANNAAKAAAAWANAGGIFGQRAQTAGAGITSKSKKTYKLVEPSGKTNKVYAVVLSSGATVIMPDDDTIGPVLAFAASGTFDLSKDSPLRELVSRDIAFRKAAVANEAAQQSRAGAGASAPAATKTQRAWAALLAGETGRAGAGAIGTVIEIEPSTVNQAKTEAITDMRVAPLLSTAWGQLHVSGEDGSVAPCYNYYTPYYYPCGCVATAMAQVMKFWRWPDAGVTLPAFSSDDTRLDGECMVDGSPTTLYSVDYPNDRYYNWDWMEDSPTADTLEAYRAAIGKLTYEAGVAANAEYSAASTGAMLSDACAAMHNQFAFAGGYQYLNDDMPIEGDKEDGLHERETRNRAIYANLDAGMPVILGITATESGAGHAVVADGYGFVKYEYDETSEGFEFTHINVGWDGTDNIWYNLPVIYPLNTGAKAGDTGYLFDLLDSAIFNIHPSYSGELLTGRVLCDARAAEGAEVAIFEAGGLESGADPVAVTNTAANGIYAFFVPGGAQYDVRAVGEYAGRAWTNVLEGVELEAFEVNPGEEATYGVTDGGIGNSWGNDIELAPSLVRAGSQHFTNLHNALWYACTNEVEDASLVEILAPVRLNMAVSITKDVTICTSPSAELGYASLAECPVSVTDNAFVRNTTADGGNVWALQVASGATLTLSNVLFKTESKTYSKPPMVDVQAADDYGAARLAIAGEVSVGGVVVRDEDSFAVVAPFTLSGEGIGIDCPSVEAFGVFECEEADIAGSVANIVNLGSPDALRGAAKVDEDGAKLLVWEAGGVSRIEDANAYFVSIGEDDAETTNFFYSIDALFSANTDCADVTVLRTAPPSAWTRTANVSGALKIVGVPGEDGSVPLLTFGGDKSMGAFTIAGESASLEISGMAVSRSSAAIASLFTVSGGASLVFGDGATVVDVVIGNSKDIASVVDVRKGSFTMLDGSSISGCSSPSGATANSPSVLFLLGEGCSFDMRGGSITGCSIGQSSNDNTGVVKAQSKSSVKVSGNAVISGNTGKGGVAKNLWVAPDETPVFAVGGALGDDAAIGVACAASGGFASVTGLSGEEAASAAARFTNDADASLVAAVAASGDKLEWSAVEDEDDGTVDEAEASAGVVAADGATTNYYADVAAAFAAAGAGGMRVVLCRDAVLSKSVEISADTVLDGCGHTLMRRAPYGQWDVPISFAVSGAAFAVTNTVFDGGVTNEIPVLGRMFSVSGGGELSLEDGASLCNVYCDSPSDVAPVVVWGGTFRMAPGSSISYCFNSTVRASGGALAASAVALSGHASSPTVAYLHGGSISNCYTAASQVDVAAVYVANGALASVMGDTFIRNNDMDAAMFADYGLEDSAPAAVHRNLLIHDTSELWLDGEFTGRIGYTEGISGDTNIFARVARSYASSATDEQLVLAASNFRHDATHAYGIPVVDASGEYRLAWSNVVPATGDTLVITSTVDRLPVETQYTIVRADVEIDLSDEDLPETVTCEPFEIVSISKSADGATWEIVLKNGTLRCKYVLRSSDTLETPLAEWPQVDAIDALESFEGTDDPEADRAFRFTPSVTEEGRRFWYVEGYDGEVK